ncbi:hypothetical protein KY359_05965 [Candidatus Woesearchaeota archaeon]|nr:hypothetical protein [Candidatus Woesearchaeota archaeon]
MVELNSTIFPFLGPIGTFVNTIKVLVGGVFGIYLIILYLRFREYTVMRKMLTEIRQDLRVIAEKQGIEMEPIKETRIKKLSEHIKDMFARHKEELQQEPEKPAKKGKRHG